MIPVRAARMSAGSAATRAACAEALLPLAIASSTLRSELRMRERRPLFTAVRRAILRVAFLADLVLAIDPSVELRPRLQIKRRRRPRKKQRRRDRRRDGTAYSGVAGGRQRQELLNLTPRRASCRTFASKCCAPNRSRHPFGPHLIVPGNNSGAVGSWKDRQWRHHLGPGEIIVDVGEQGFHARYQCATVEQLAD